MNNEAASARGAGLAQAFGSLRAHPMLAFAIAAAAVVAVVAVLLMWAGRPEYRVLFSNLGEADGGRIIAALDQRGVPYRFSEGGQALLVPAAEVHVLRLQLAEEGLPRGGNVGLEVMDQQRFGASQFAEQISFQRGLEGELSRSIGAMSPVASARVHLALARNSVFVREREPAKASVVVGLHSGRSLSEGQVRAIVHLVSSSVPELAAENVTVVGDDGRLLSTPAAGARDVDNTQLDFVAEIERSFQRRIENILAPLFGAANVRAQVVAEIDFSRREETSERYGPNQAPNEAAVRSRQSTLDYGAREDLASGVPGALSNTPPATPPSPIDAPAEAAAEAGLARDPERLRRDEVVNFEVDRAVAHVQYPRGQLRRLSAAVVVNHRGETDENGAPRSVALSAEELAQVDRLVRQAIGFSAARGDQVEVVNSPFVRAENEPLVLDWWQSPSFDSLILPLVRYGLAALAALLLYLLILRPLLRRMTPPVPPVQVAAAAAAESEAAAAAAKAEEEEDVVYEPSKRKRRTSAYEAHLSSLQEMAQDDPRLIAMIVRNWMNSSE